MSTHRIERMQEELRHAISSLILFEATDPMLHSVTVTQVKMTKDLGLAKIYYEAPGNAENRQKIQASLENAAGFLRKQLSSKLKMRLSPQLAFHYDNTCEEIDRVEGLFSENVIRL